MEELRKQEKIIKAGGKDFKTIKEKIAEVKETLKTDHNITDPIEKNGKKDADKPNAADAKKQIAKEGKALSTLMEGVDDFLKPCQDPLDEAIKIFKKILKIINDIKLGLETDKEKQELAAMLLELKKLEQEVKQVEHEIGTTPQQDIKNQMEEMTKEMSTKITTEIDSSLKPGNFTIEPDNKNFPTAFRISCTREDEEKVKKIVKDQIDQYRKAGKIEDDSTKFDDKGNTEFKLKNGVSGDDFAKDLKGKLEANNLNTPSNTGNNSTNIETSTPNSIELKPTNIPK